MAQAMATAQGFSAPMFGGPAGFSPLTCPLPGDRRGRNPRITTATALLSLLLHGAAGLWLLQDSPLPSGASAPPPVVPAVSLLWVPPVAAPAPVSSAPSAPPEPVPVPDRTAPVDAPPVLSAPAGGAEVPPPAPVQMPRPPVKAAVKPAPRPAPARLPAPNPPAPVVQERAPVPSAVPAPVSSPVSSSAPPVSSPAPAEPSLLRGEEGIPVSRDARYLEPPTPPEYPRRAVQLGLEGTVLVRALVEGGGVPRTVRIVTGSGVDSLDAAAVRAVSGWKFAVSDHGSLWVEIPVHFRLR